MRKSASAVLLLVAVSFANDKMVGKFPFTCSYPSDAKYYYSGQGSPTQRLCGGV